MEFSTIITAPSTISPKSSAPKLIRLAETPASTMPETVASMLMGMTVAVIRAARILPNRRNRTTTTKSAPTTRFSSTVAMALSTNTVLSYSGSAMTPSGSVVLISSSFAATSRATVREFSPNNINAVPITAS